MGGASPAYTGRDKTLDKKRTALIERKIGVGEAKYSTSTTGSRAIHVYVEQEREGINANEDHFAMGITFAIANQNRARNVKRTIKHQVE